jgi:hypothetical protein
VTDVVVTADDEGYAIAAVNKNRDEAVSVDLRMLDGDAKMMRISSVSGPSPDSYNDVDRTEVGITYGEWTEYKPSITVPAHTACVIEIK